MGCDIHLYFEKKNVEGKWEKIDVPENLMPDERYYDLFGFLAGVRNYDMPAQFPDRGFPDDTSVSKEKYDLMGDHNFTYAYIDEILNAPFKENELDRCYFYIFCKYVLPRLISDWGSDWNDFEPMASRKVRVVMGFDN